MADFIKTGEFIYSGAHADTKPTGVDNTIVCIETDTGDKYSTPDHGTTWNLRESGLASIDFGAAAEADFKAQTKAGLVDDNLDHLMKTVCADTSDPVSMAVEVPANTVLANILSDDGDTAQFDRRTMSLEAIAAHAVKLAGATPTVGASASTNWNTGTGTSGEAGADLVTIGADNVKNKILSFLVNLVNITAGAVVTIKMYQQINGVEAKVYSQSFLVGTDPNGCWIIQGMVGIHEALRVEVYSSANEAKIIPYDYMLEVM